MIDLNSSQNDVEELVDVDVLLDLDSGSQLIIYNDDVNTFDWVIQSLIDVCSHSFEQAEQLSLIIHFKGKACAKTDSLEVLKPMKDSLTERGLSAVIESIKDKR
jgi:ATP-dependent Clp protease adaptor protein ClpS